MFIFCGAYCRNASPHQTTSTDVPAYRWQWSSQIGHVLIVNDKGYCLVTSGCYIITKMSGGCSVSVLHPPSVIATWALCHKQVSKYQGKSQVITSHRYCGMWLFVVGKEMPTPSFCHVNGKDIKSYFVINHGVAPLIIKLILKNFSVYLTTRHLQPSSD